MTQQDELQNHLAQASRILQSCKIWGGMGWKWNDMPPAKYHEAAKHVRAALDIVLAQAGVEAAKPVPANEVSRTEPSQHAVPNGDAPNN